MLRTVLLPGFAALSLFSLVSCGGGGETAPPELKTVTVQDNGAEFTYQTSSAFQPQLMETAQLGALEQQMFAALNAERQRGGTCTRPDGQVVQNPPAGPLKLEARIYAAATAHASAMIRQHFTGHLNPFEAASRTPTRRMVGAGYKPLAPLKSSGETLFFEESLAYGHLTPAEVIAAWKNESFDHCMSIYVKLTYGAVAVQEGQADSEYPRYWVLNLSGNLPTN